MSTSQANPWTELRVAIQTRLETVIDGLTAYPWTGQSDEDVLALARTYGRVAWVRVVRVDAQEPAPRDQDAVALEVSLLAVAASQNPGIAAVAGQDATAHEQSEALVWEIRNQFRDCLLADWLTGRGLEFVRQEILFQDPTAVAVELRFAATGHVTVFADSVSDVSPLPSRIAGQYSADGEAWHDAYQEGDLYTRWSLDYGQTWGGALRFAGPVGPQGDQGPAGTAAPELQVQWSTDGETWTDQPGDSVLYIRTSSDSGATWSDAALIGGTGNLDGGAAASLYGGLSAIDGGAA